MFNNGDYNTEIFPTIYNKNVFTDKLTPRDEDLLLQNDFCVHCVCVGKYLAVLKKCLFEVLMKLLLCQ